MTDPRFRVRITSVPHGFMVWHGPVYVGCATELDAAHIIADRYAHSPAWVHNNAAWALREEWA